MRLAQLIWWSFLRLVIGSRLKRDQLASRVSHAPPMIFSCICSTALGHAVEKECSPSCSVENCHRSEIISNESFDWTPLLEGRGTCCLSSITAIRDGCPLEATSITENGAKSILADALQQAERNDIKSAFVVEGSEHLLKDMTESFETAKEKKMNTSRSGAQFFFSGNYRYILKSIHTPEYDVLQQLAAPIVSGPLPLPFPLPLPRPPTPLLRHMESFKLLDEKLRVVGNCGGLTIQASRRGWEVTAKIEKRSVQRSAQRLAGSLPTGVFDGVWEYSRELADTWGIPVYGLQTGNHFAFWCEAISGWRVHRKSYYHGVRAPQKVVQCEEQEDALYEWLEQKAKSLEIDPAAVNVVYRDFTLAFQEEKTSIERPIGSGTVTGRCTQSWCDDHICQSARVKRCLQIEAAKGARSLATEPLASGETPLCPNARMAAGHTLLTIIFDRLQLQSLFGVCRPFMVMASFLFNRGHTRI